MPDLGGSIITVSGIPFSFTKVLLSTFLISPVKKLTFFMEFNVKFSLAARTASLTVSIPITFLA